MDPVMSFFRRAMELKQLKRAGWVRCGVTPCESVAEHTFGVSVLALVLSRAAGVDRGKCLALAVVHDLAEAIVGDITPADGIAADEKLRREREAIAELSRLLNDAEIANLWDEYEHGETPESQLVRDLDAIEMALQATTYLNQKLLDVSQARQFVNSARARVQTPTGKQLLDNIVSAEEA